MCREIDAGSAAVFCGDLMHPRAGARAAVSSRSAAIRSSRRRRARASWRRLRPRHAGRPAHFGRGTSAACGQPRPASISISCRGRNDRLGQADRRLERLLSCATRPRHESVSRHRGMEAIPRIRRPKRCTPSTIGRRAAAVGLTVGVTADNPPWSALSAARDRPSQRQDEPWTVGSTGRRLVPYPGIPARTSAMNCLPRRHVPGPGGVRRCRHRPARPAVIALSTPRRAMIYFINGLQVGRATEVRLGLVGNRPSRFLGPRSLRPPGQPSTCFA